MLLKFLERYIKCKFCNERCLRGINRYKHHLAGTHHGMRPCTKVSEDLRLVCKEAMNNFKGKKKNELLEKIGMGPNPINKSSFCKTIGSRSGNGSVSG